MKTIQEKFESGKIEVVQYSRDDALNHRIRVVVSDIYRNLPEFDKDIFWIRSVIPEKDKTISDVLDDYCKSIDAENLDGLLICEAGTLNRSMKVFGSIAEAKEVIESQKGYILESFFYNVIFNRRMSRCYTNTNVMICSGLFADSFIKDNMGGNDKIINRAEASGKAN